MEASEGVRERLLVDKKSQVDRAVGDFVLGEGNKRYGSKPWPEVVGVYRLALQIGEMLGDKQLTAKALNSIGNVLRQTGDGSAARSSYERGLKISEEIKDNDLIARLSYNLSDFPEYGDAFLIRSLRLAKESDNKAMIAMASGKLGNRYTMRGEYVQSRELLTEALRMRRELGDPEGISIALSNLAILQMQLGEYEEARENLLECLKIDGNFIDTYNLGNLYFFIGDYTSALDRYHQSLEVLKRDDPNDEGAPIKINIANLYREQGNLEQAETMYRQTLASFEKSKANYGIARSLGGLRDVFEDKGDLQNAIKYAERAHELYVAEKDAEVTRSSWKLGSLYALAGDEKKAEEYLRKSVALAEERKAGEFESHLALAKFYYRRRDVDAAYKSATAASTSIGNDQRRPDSWKAHDLMGNIHLARGEKANARARFEKAVALIEGQRRFVAGGDDESRRYLAARLAPYYSLLAILIDARDSNAAFQLSESIKARTLLEAVIEPRRSLADGMSDSERIAAQRLANEIVALNVRIAKQTSAAAASQLIKDLESARLQYEDLTNRIYASKPDVRIRRGEMKPLGLSEVHAEKPSGGLTVSFVTGNTQSFAIVITGKVPNGARIIPIPVTREVLLGKTTAFRTTLASGDLGFQKASRDLYDLLVKPIEKELAGKTNLVIVPDGPLWDLPFQALQDDKGTYLVEKAAVSYAPSLTALREMRKKARARKPTPDAELLAFGNPIVGKETKERVQRVFMSEKLEPLPEAERLVNELGRMYGPKRSRVFVGAEAREEIAKAESPKYRIVQFATHGILNNVSPMYSHLVFARNDKNPDEDGLLEAWELKDLDLKADMVILSACETARGKIANGEGVIGMTWAAFIAGAPTTVASQWKVESSSATELMLEFHRQLLSKQGVAKAEALRRASLKVMKMSRYRHPMYWAGFVLVGDGS